MCDAQCRYSTGAAVASYGITCEWNPRLVCLAATRGATAQFGSGMSAIVAFGKFPQGDAFASALSDLTFVEAIRRWPRGDVLLCLGRA